MYNDFRNALDNATGQSEDVVIVFVDIRGFTNFFKTKDSHDTAKYIKRVYIQLIDEYFPSATFYKPTGDGLLVVIKYDHKTIQDKCKEVIKSCLRCHDEFAEICKGDPMVNFDVPKSVGIGVSRGTACCLKSDDVILDYSGHLLNLASRLMDIARPSGIVIDGAFKIDLLSKEDQELFAEDKAFLRSIAEDKPIKVYVLKGVVSIPIENKRPFSEKIVTKEYTCEEWKSMTAKWFSVFLESPSENPEELKVSCVHKDIGGKLSNLNIGHPFSDFRYLTKLGRPVVDINLKTLKSYLESKNLPYDAKVKIIVDYGPKPK